eukprot:scaffold12763_cov115-Isochrysis_galbana.AAC.4
MQCGAVGLDGDAAHGVPAQPRPALRCTRGLRRMLVPCRPAMRQTSTASSRAGACDAFLMPGARLFTPGA